MSTNHTPNYALSQWEAGDPVLRADFNADNAKIDAALAELQANQLRIATGTYMGNDGHTKTIELPFPPKFFWLQKAHLEERRIMAFGTDTVLVCNWNGERLAMYNGRGTQIKFKGNILEVVAIETGQNDKDAPKFAMNESGDYYCYMALG